MMPGEALSDSKSHQSLICKSEGISRAAFMLADDGTLDPHQEQAFLQLSFPSVRENRLRGAVALFQSFVEMGDLGTLQHYLQVLLEDFKAANDQYFDATHEKYMRAAEMMQEIENNFGPGACLQPNHPTVVELISLEPPEYTKEMLENAARFISVRGSHYLPCAGGIGS